MGQMMSPLFIVTNPQIRIRDKLPLSIPDQCFGFPPLKFSHLLHSQHLFHSYKPTEENVSSVV